jgi:hypothetical protein
MVAREKSRRLGGDSRVPRAHVELPPSLRAQAGSQEKLDGFLNPLLGKMEMSRALLDGIEIGIDEGALI